LADLLVSHALLLLLLLPQLPGNKHDDAVKNFLNKLDAIRQTRVTTRGAWTVE